MDNTATMTIDYKFNEPVLIREMSNYIDNTYEQHYAKGERQALEDIIDAGYGMGFCMGNAMKYPKRYGKKDGFNRNDILKFIHYGILALYVHDRENNESE